MSTSASSRSATQPAGAGRSASELVGIGAAPRARVRAAKAVNAELTVLQIFRSVVDDPVARCARSAPAPSPPRPGEADVSIGADPELQRLPPNLRTTNSAKKKCRRRPAAAAPPSRPVQVGRRQSALESAPPRARAWPQPRVLTLSHNLSPQFVRGRLVIIPASVSRATQLCGGRDQPPVPGSGRL